MHPLVVAELALGSLQDRSGTLAQLDSLPKLSVVSLPDVTHMIEIRALYSRGIGLTDAHLLASCLVTPGTLLWTSDVRLANIAQELGIGASL